MERLQQQQQFSNGQFNGSYNFNTGTIEAVPGTSQGTTEAQPPKVSKEVHRMQFEMELMRKQYEEAMQQYKQQIEQYSHMLRHVPPPGMPGSDQPFPVNQVPSDALHPPPEALANGLAVPIEPPNPFLEGYEHEILGTLTPVVETIADFAVDETMEFDEPSSEQSYLEWRFDAPKEALIECTSSVHELRSDEVAVAYTDYGVEYVPVKKRTQEQYKPSCVFPPPGTYYESEENVYYMPQPSNSNDDLAPAVQCVFDSALCIPELQLSGESFEGPLHKQWKRCKTGDRSYYYNKKSKVVTWTLPGFKSRKLPEILPTSDAPLTSLPSPKSSAVSEEISFTPPLQTRTIIALTTPPAPAYSPLDAAKSRPPTPEGAELIRPFAEITSDPRMRKMIREGKTFPISQSSSSHTNERSVHSAGRSSSANHKHRHRHSEKEKKERGLKIFERFKSEVTEHIKKVLNPYQKPDCRVGRITCIEDFKILARTVSYNML